MEMTKIKKRNEIKEMNTKGAGRPDDQTRDDHSHLQWTQFGVIAEYLFFNESSRVHVLIL